MLAEKEAFVCEGRFSLLGQEDRRWEVVCSFLFMYFSDVSL